MPYDCLMTQVTRSIEVRKAVEAIHSSGELSLLERRLANVLLLQAYENLPSCRHSIPVAVLMELLGWEQSRNFQDLKDALGKIRKTELEFDLVTPTGERKWANTSLIGWADIKNGICSYEYVPSMAEMLANPTIYAVINIQVQREFNSSYALNLYENCVRYTRVGSTGAHSVGTWRKLLGATAPNYDEFKRFNERVISKAVQEVNDVTDIDVKPRFIRKGRTVVEISFDVVNKKQQSLFHTNGEEADLLSTKLFERGRALGLAQDIILGMLKANKERTELAFQSAERAVKEKNVRNPAGYAVKLYKDGVFDAPILQEKRSKVEASLRKVAAQQHQESKKNELSARKRAYFKSLPPSAQAEYKQRFSAEYGTTYNEATGRFARTVDLPAFNSWLLQNID